MKTKFTPGPWEVMRKQAHHTMFEIKNSGGQKVAVVYDEQNAHLIASAPELYEALEEAVEKFRPIAQTLSELGCIIRVNAALAKARGES